MRIFVIAALMSFIDLLDSLYLRELELGGLAVLVVAHGRGVYYGCTGGGLILQ